MSKNRSHLTQVSQGEHLLTDLNDPQRAAVECPTVPLCIRAGAGTGKTRVLTRRIAYQADRGAIDPRRTLALTFTRKAAEELRSRLRGLGMSHKPTAGTFHAIALRQLHDFWADRGINPPQLMASKRGLLRRVSGQLKRNELQELQGEVEWAKACNLTPENYQAAAARPFRQTSLGLKRIAELYQRYEDEKRSRRVVDYDDLLSLCLHYLQENPDYAEAQRWNFQHFFVDEFQDVNPLQFALLQAWLGDRPELCVVGDARQAIYGWNGADSRYLLNFPEYFRGGEVLELLDNYRSSPQILHTAHNVLKDRNASPLRAHRPDASHPTVSGHIDDRTEAIAIARALRDAQTQQTPWSDMAVLVRTNGQIACIEKALQEAQIPYRVRMNSDLSEEAATPKQLRPPNDANQQPADTATGVHVMTFHASKGLEWPIVHVAGMEQGLVPVVHAASPAALAEEHRLLYVVVTRAQRELHFHWAAHRSFGTHVSSRSPSPYLDTILQSTITQPIITSKSA